MPQPVNKRVSDSTRTERAKAHLTRLEESGGKRVLVDFDAEGRAALEKLVLENYGATMREAIIRAVKEAAKKLK